MIKKEWECHPNPESRLGQQPKGHRFAKRQADYRKRAGDIRERWPHIVKRLTEAKRFQDEFMVVVPRSPDLGTFRLRLMSSSSQCRR